MRQPRSTAALALALILASPFVLATGTGARTDPGTGTTRSRPLRMKEDDAELRALMLRHETEGTAAGESFQWSLEPSREGRLYDSFELTFPSPLASGVEQNDTVHARYWRPKGEGPFAAAVVLHWLGGSFEALDLVCKLLAEAEVAAVMVYMPFYGPRRPEGSERRMLERDNDLTLANYRQALLDIRRAGDWLAARPEVDPERLGLMGISLGGMVGAVAAGVDDHFGRLVICIGGGDLPAIVLNETRETRHVRREIEERGLTVDDLRESWRPIEPLTYAKRLSSASTLMVLAEEDEIIPRACSLKLKDAIGIPDENVLWHGGGHYALALHFLWVVPKAARWLKGEPHSPKGK